ncbi:MAG: ABC transporter substrate-binding protein [Candidatus Dormibacteraeota bacterium]|nr:ABC transporter substrate-binding protein [Candidatus Dormibacteraeota bacterium]
MDTRSFARRSPWRLALGLFALVAVACQSSTGTTSTASTTTIKLGILSDCTGDFGTFYNDDIGGALAVFAAKYGGKPKGSKPSDGMTGIKIGGKNVDIVGFGCSDSTANKAIEETRRLTEQLGADILIGPLSGDEGIAVANYAKSQPNKTFLNGIAGAQDATLKVRAPNFFRFNPDGAQWSAGLGDYAYSKLGWRSAAVIGDDYAFPYTSLAGFIAEFCSVGGNVTQRIWPPLGTTDYSSFITQIPANVDGLFVGVGGAGLISFLKQYQQLKGALNTKKVMGNTFWPDPQLLKAIGTPMVGAVAASGIAADDTSAQATEYKKQLSIYPGLANDAASVFTLGYWSAATALGQALTAVSGDISNGQKSLMASLAKQVVDGPYGQISLDENRQAIFDNWVVQITPPAAGTNVPGIKTIERIPKVDQSFGGFFTPSTPAPSRTDPACVKKTPPPWVGNAQPATFS